MKITFPWYPKQLSPNANVHHFEKAKYKKIYKSECYYHTKAEMPKYPVKTDYTILKITFYKPNNRHMDLDNMLASIKSGIDGMSDALQINDKQFTQITVIKSDKIGGYIEVEVI